jgi:hypothetical protein
LWRNVAQPKGIAVSVLTLSRNLFARHLDLYGQVGTWKRRTQGEPVTPDSDRSSAYKRRDPVTDGNWQAVFEDPHLWTQESLPVIMDVPQSLMVSAVGPLLEGESFAYCAHDKAVQAGDMLLLDGIFYSVSSSKVPSPAVYREVTLKRLS